MVIQSRKVTKNLRRFRKMKFDYNKFVKRYYIENGDAYISAKVNSYDDIINRFSVKNYEWINREFVQYLEDSAYYIPEQNKIILSICGCKFTAEQQNTIRRVILDYFGLQMEDRISDLSNNLKSVNRTIFGAVLAGALYVFIASTYIYKMSVLVPDILQCIFWVFLWETIGKIALERRKLIDDKLFAGQLTAMEIRFEEEKDLTVQDPNIAELDELYEMENYTEEAVGQIPICPLE